jgi:crossover junction endodeoxyribonuclease RusA
MELLNTNDRAGHWGRRKRLTGDLRAAAGWLAKQQKVPHLERARILGIYEPPDRRRRDPANYYPSFKACIDGICDDAGVLSDDDAEHLDGPDMRLGPVHPKGRIVLIITEVTG